ncbi:putative oligopeptide ABC transporter ATP-binding protein (plasmid) [Ketogulonicigenium vulgare Y25]|uniref:Oligopeptide/dipeptide ABC transporter, ATPase subunit n=1 Tax=Ketogulonicigenium vulgare (strain WSH-001) TaxID=759362 RepID=F9YBF7_KETVW|nr:ATP-binding cassette domain-containing protein [Ketogulonicigenium vulgare]ADO44272.1 putative oligopeptide ABC transporter ATP-binding protein [Ketogulonicigenium vulgare Y25]AEM42709.1 Oligopeptide/dipeptide ABC transporter, ATPase subunit [Ketogulonicigenium vulgare WSH-001]ALJ82841.1 hypothetical protein KVH_16210 [Ketogulonicigenium vulgare]
MTLEITHVTKQFGSFTALKDVSLSVRKGSSLGLVGESGSGKSTLARCILRLDTLTAGQITYAGTDIHAISAAEMRALRARLQIVFQDPYASLNQRMSVHDIIAEPLIIHKARFPMTASQRTARVLELLVQVGLGPEHLYRFPHEFSGGQRQRIGIARALACEPEFLILDEPTSALDVSVQADILNLLQGLQDRLGLTYLFISHDLAVVRYMCDEVAVIYHGEIVEHGPASLVLDAPQHDYTRMLLAAMPDPDPDKSPFLHRI